MAYGQNAFNCDSHELMNCEVYMIVTYSEVNMIETKSVTKVITSVTRKLDQFIP